MKKPRLIPIANQKELKKLEIHATRNHLAKLCRENKYPDLFVKIFGRVFINADAFRRLFKLNRLDLERI
ncbi:MAG: hypothetical protein ACD_59C00056G0005 [uncultured bacterium]|jgi:hypothetical protein|nr:MAG: hypothetical protein ACD_59C00056G0005 [uncultured bacterium]